MLADLDVLDVVLEVLHADVDGHDADDAAPARIGAELDIIVVLLTSSYAGSSQKTSFGP